jgi:hypothetical protein
MTSTQAIVDSIENRLRELNREIETLVAARSALDDLETASTQRPRSDRARPAAARSRARRPRSTRRAKPRNGGEIVPAGRLESLLSENGGLTTSALADRTNGDRDQILTLLRELETAGRIRRTGQRRSTRWHAITDEDRIRERAAELAARSRRRT